ncbi:MAG: alpha/beta hydrolase [Gammaproteobacteria bacterium]|nr:alpha/beta hydrolase [Gammaproteobacteria bacterium]
MQALLDARADLPPATSVAEERANWSRYALALAVPPPADMSVDDRVLQTAERPVTVRVYRPAGAARGSLPGLIYLHGGGFMKGDLDSSDSVAWGFAEQAQAVVISVDYRLTPEHPYPAAFDDAYAVTAHVARNAADFGIDPTRLGIAGDSAGGNLAAATCLAARDRNGMRLRCQVLVYPGTGLDQVGGSYDEHANAFGLSTENTRRYRDYYLPDDPETRDPYARPVLAEDLSDLPVAWVHSAEMDPIRDDGRVFASKLALAGTEVHYREAKGMIHGFMRARFKGAAAAAEYDAICNFMRQQLHG